MKLSLAKDYLPLIKAAAEGETLQVFLWPGGEWQDMRAENELYLPAARYRIKPQSSSLKQLLDLGYRAERFDGNVIKLNMVSPLVSPAFPRRLELALLGFNLDERMQLKDLIVKTINSIKE